MGQVLCGDFESVNDLGRPLSVFQCLQGQSTDTVAEQSQCFDNKQKKSFPGNPIPSHPPGDAVLQSVTFPMSPSS